MLFTSLYLEIFIWTISILLHELAHILLAYIFGVRKFTIELSLFGSTAMFNNYTLGKYQKLLVYLAGPIINLLLVITCLFINDSSERTNKFIENLYTFNIYMLVFSCLFIYPLDGYQCLALFIKRKIIRIISYVFLLFFLVLGIITKSGMVFILFGFLLLKNISYKKEYRERKLMQYYYCYQSKFDV